MMNRVDITPRIIDIHISPQELREIADKMEESKDTQTVYIYDKGEIRYFYSEPETVN